MATTQLLTIPARRGTAARVAAGQRVKVINTHGTQVVDTWAFNARDVTEWMSMEASRAWFMKLRAAVGDAFLTNQRRPILTLVEDTSGGAHDTLMAACDVPRYRLLGVEGHHGPRDAVAAQPVHEHSLDGRRDPRMGRARLRAGELRGLSRGDRSGRRVLRLPAGHPAYLLPDGADHRGPLHHRVGAVGE